MKKLMIIAGEVYPNPSPVGKIAIEYGQLLKDEFDVTILFANKSCGATDVRLDGVRYVSVDGIRNSLENLLTHREKATTVPLFKKTYRMLSFCLILFRRLQSEFLFPNNLKWHYKSCLHMLRRLDDWEKIDALLSICAPISSHMAALAFKREKSRINWVSFTIDPFVSGIKYKKSKRYIAKARRLEADILHTADSSLLTEELYQLQFGSGQTSHSNVYPVPYILKPLPCNNKVYFDKNKINFVFAGKFYSNLRHPEYLLKTFSAIHDENVVLHLFSYGDCDSLVDKYVKSSKGRIIKHDLVPAHEISSVLFDADFLVNVGNSTLEFKPSKTYEYIATGKPILHFFQNGFRDEALDHYPLSLQIDQENPDFAWERDNLIRFYNANKGTQLDFDEVLQRYPQNAQSAIKEILLGVLK